MFAKPSFVHGKHRLSAKQSFTMNFERDSLSEAAMGKAALLDDESHHPVTGLAVWSFSQACPRCLAVRTDYHLPCWKFHGDNKASPRVSDLADLPSTGKRLQPGNQKKTEARKGSQEGTGKEHDQGQFWIFNRNRWQEKIDII